MDMLAVQLLRHTAGFLRADVPAGNLRYGFHIAAALGMYDLAVLIRLAVAAVSIHSRNIAAVTMGMDAFRYRMIAFVSVFVVTVVSFHGSGIPTFRGMLRVVITQTIIFFCSRRCREIAQHQHQHQDPAQHPLKEAAFHRMTPSFRVIPSITIIAYIPEKSIEKGKIL